MAGSTTGIKKHNRLAVADKGLTPQLLEAT